MGGLRLDEIKADRARLGTLGPDAVADRLLGVLRHQGFELDLGALMLEKRVARVERKIPANSAQEFEVLISTTRTASMRGSRRLDQEQPWGLPGLDTAPELPLRRDQEGAGRGGRPEW